MNKSQEQAFRFLTEYPAQYGQMLGYDDLRDELHGRWIKEMLLGKSDMTLQSHRGSYKTTCLCIAIAEMLMLRGDRNIIFLRKTDSDITEVIRNVQRILYHPVTQELYRTLTGTVLSVSRATNEEVTTSAYTAPRGSAQLLGIGINGSLTGKHADLIITDDIVNLKDRISKAEREHTKSVYMELQNLRNRGGRIINTGTPWHKEDAFCIMPEAEKFDCYQTGIITKEKLDELRKVMSPSLFAANYELRHIASENALFSEAPCFFDDPCLLADGIAHIDAAYQGEDYTAFTLAKRKGDKIYMHGRMWRAHVDTVIDIILEECRKYKCAPIYCEINGDKGYLSKELRRKGASTSPYSEPMNKYLKISTYLRKWWKNIEWSRDTDPAYLAQIMDYTEDAEHDDAPDSAACCCRKLDRTGITL